MSAANAQAKRSCARQVPILWPGKWSPACTGYTRRALSSDPAAKGTGPLLDRPANAVTYGKNPPAGVFLSQIAKGPRKPTDNIHIYSFGFPNRSNRFRNARSVGRITPITGTINTKSRTVVSVSKQLTFLVKSNSGTDTTKLMIPL